MTKKTLAERKKLASQAEKGDEAARREVVESILADAEKLDAAIALFDGTQTWLKLAGQSHESGSTLLLHKAERLKAKLLKDGDSELERLLVERIALCWLQCAFFSEQFARKIASGEALVSHLEFFSKQMSQAEKRFAAGCKTLGQVRKVNVAIQVSIGKLKVSQKNHSLRLGQQMGVF